MTQSYLMVDTLVILSAGFVFGWKRALYAVITLYVSGIVAETTFEGRGMVRTALLVTSQPDAVARQVLEVLRTRRDDCSGDWRLHGRTARCCTVSFLVRRSCS